MRTLLGLVVALAACGNSNNGGDDAPPPDGTTMSPVTPKVGLWGYDEVTPVSRTCPGTIDQGGTGTFGIDSSSPTGFHVVPNDGTAPFSCTLSGAAFDCPDRASATEDLHPQFDAVVTAHAVATGNFATATQASGRQEATVTCAGTQCAATGIQFPCTIKVDFVIRAR